MSVIDAQTSGSSPFFSQSVEEKDPELFQALKDELKRQKEEIELIA